MFIKTKKSLEVKIRKLAKRGVPEHSIKMIEYQIERAASKREYGKTLDTPKERKEAYQRALNEIGFAVNLCWFAERSL